MLSYFVPITLMVLAGFLLGLMVGRLAWGGSKVESVRTRVPEVDQADLQDGTVEKVEASATLPVWEMEEVVPLETQGSNMPPINVKRFRP